MEPCRYGVVRNLALADMYSLWNLAHRYGVVRIAIEIKLFGCSYIIVEPCRYDVVRNFTFTTLDVYSL